MKRLWLILALLDLLVFALPRTALADLPFLTRTVTLTDANQQATFTQQLSGQGACGVAITSNAENEDVNIYVSVDGTNYVPVNVVDYAGGSAVSSINSGTYHGDCSAVKQLKVALANPTSDSNVVIALTAGQSSPAGSGGGGGSSYTFAEPLVNDGSGNISFDYAYEGTFSQVQEFDGGIDVRGLNETDTTYSSGCNYTGVMVGDLTHTGDVWISCVDPSTGNMEFDSATNGLDFTKFQFPVGGFANNANLCTDSSTVPVITTTGCASGGMPAYTQGGVASAAHCVINDFTSGGTSASITFVAPAAFSSFVSSAWAINNTTHALVPTANITSVTTTGISFGSITTGDVYGFTVCGV